MWTPYWDWFYSFTEFFAVTFGRLILASLLILLILVLFESLVLVIIAVGLSILKSARGVAQ